MTEILTPKEVAEILQLNYLTVIKMLRSGELTGFKLGNNKANAVWRIDRTDLQRYIIYNRLTNASNSFK